MTNRILLFEFLVKSRNQGVLQLCEGAQGSLFDVAAPAMLLICAVFLSEMRYRVYVSAPAGSLSLSSPREWSPSRRCSGVQGSAPVRRCHLLLSVTRHRVVEGEIFDFVGLKIFMEY